MKRRREEKRGEEKRKKKRRLLLLKKDYDEVGLEAGLFCFLLLVAGGCLLTFFC